MADGIREREPIVIRNRDALVMGTLLFFGGCTVAVFALPTAFLAPDAFGDASLAGGYGVIAAAIGYRIRQTGLRVGPDGVLSVGFRRTIKVPPEGVAAIEIDGHRPYNETPVIRLVDGREILIRQLSIDGGMPEVRQRLLYANAELRHVLWGTPHQVREPKPPIKDPKATAKGFAGLAASYVVMGVGSTLSEEAAPMLFGLWILGGMVGMAFYRGFRGERDNR